MLIAYSAPAPAVKSRVEEVPTTVPALSTATPPPPLPPLPPASNDQVFVDVHPYRFCPAGAMVTKNI
jgi:hypothetical protein